MEPSACTVKFIFSLPVFGGFLFVEFQFAVDRMADVFDKAANIKYNYANNYLCKKGRGSPLSILADLLTLLRLE